MTNYTKFDYDGYTFDFTPKSQGFQLTVTQGERTVYDYQMLMQTQFEALMSAASKIYGDSVEAEAIAKAGKIPYRFWDDADCRDCVYYGDYLEMTPVENGEYLCYDCAAKQDDNPYEITADLCAQLSDHEIAEMAIGFLASLSNALDHRDTEKMLELQLEADKLVAAWEENN